MRNDLTDIQFLRKHWEILWQKAHYSWSLESGNLGKSTWASLCFWKISKFPVFSLTGIFPPVIFLVFTVQWGLGTPNNLSLPLHYTPPPPPSSPPPPSHTPPFSPIPTPLQRSAILVSHTPLAPKTWWGRPSGERGSVRAGCGVSPFLTPLVGTYTCTETVALNGYINVCMSLAGLF